jgi:hypothetical protein
MREHWILPTEQELAMAGPDWLLLLVHKNSLEVLEKKNSFYYGIHGVCITR